jgi:hypothetical protein
MARLPAHIDCKLAVSNPVSIYELLLMLALSSVGFVLLKEFTTYTGYRLCVLGSGVNWYWGQKHGIWP